MYVLISDDGLIVSYSPEEYPGSTYIEIASFPDNWGHIFSQSKLGYVEETFFVFDEYIPESEMPQEAPSE
jgi:hypothetical protein